MTKRKGGRKAAGQMVWKASGWRARVRIPQADGTKLRKLVDLGTANKGVARRKMKALVAKLESGAVPPDEIDAAVAAGLTVDVFAAEYYERREKIGVKSWKDEKRWFTKCIQPHIGNRPIDHVESTDITDLLVAAVAAGRPRESLKKIRVECMRLFRAARRAKLIAASPVDDADTPKVKERKKPRVILTDAEFIQYVQHPDLRFWTRASGTVDREIKVMAILSRTLGGMRASDLAALSWDVVDRVNFDRVLIFRPKTQTEDVYIVPAVARPFLAAWHADHDKPNSGPVFPVRRGKRAGEHKQKHSPAHRLRRDLLIAGVDRHEVHSDTDRTKRADFHSFRRALSTAMKRAGVPARDAMRVTGHTSFETHQSYVIDDAPIPAPPAEALPALLPPAAVGHERCPMNDGESDETGSGWQDLNLQQPAPKAGPLPG